MNTIKIALQIPFKVLLKRIIKRLIPSPKTNYSKLELRQTSSNFKLNTLLTAHQLNSTFRDDIVNHYLNQEFNLLGSGWVNRNLKKEVEQADQHCVFTNQLRQTLPKDYPLIDWQLDVRSGFRFDIKKQFDAQEIPQNKNVDIKNCWELGRLQHFPQMALAAVNQSNKIAIITAFKHQSLDFILSNPIGMGVQFSCAMDVGIRVSNWLVALDIFRQVDTTTILNDQFIETVTAYIYSSTQFIMQHLEQKEGAAGNHYLFNLIGVLFATNYLSATTELATWRKKAEKELEKEFFKQFFSDGGNFEGSTTYHCLSAEAILYATALMLRNDKQLSSKYIQLLSKTYQFIEDVMKPTGEMPQFGDNDSGRLFVFQQQNTLLNYEGLLSGFKGLFENEKDDAVSCKIIQQLSNQQIIKYFPKKEVEQILKKQPLKKLQHTKTTTLQFNSSINLNKITPFSYKEFGIYGFKSDTFYLAISAISNPKMHHSWGHVHNDKLSFELQVNGNDLVKDPGTYSYSAFPTKRNELRSSEAHHGICVDGIDQNKAIGLFYLERETICKVLEVRDFSITLQVNYYGVEHVRKLTILSDQLLVEDHCNHPFKVNINSYKKYSPNYGELKRVIGSL